MKKLFLFAVFTVFFIAATSIAVAGDPLPTIHMPPEHSKTTVKEAEWIKSEIERIYPEALAQVVKFVGTEDAKKAFRDFHVQIRDSLWDDGYWGRSVSYYSRSKTRSQRQSIAIAAQPAFTGVLNIKQVLIHEMLHVVYEYAYGSNDWWKVPKFVSEGISYYGAGQIEKRLKLNMNFQMDTIHEQWQVLNDEKRMDRLRYQTFIYMFERQYGLDARKQVLLSMWNKTPYKKAFEKAAGEDWKKIKNNCKNQLSDFVQQSIENGGPYRELRKEYKNAKNDVDWNAFIKSAEKFKIDFPQTAWIPNIDWMIARAYRNSYDYENALKMFEKIRTGKAGLGYDYWGAALQLLKTRLWMCECEKAQELRNEYERLYPVFLRSWKEKIDQNFNKHCDSRQGNVQDFRTYFHKTGEKMSEGEYKNLRPIGKHIYYHPNGGKKSEASYIGGYINGPYISWHDNGKKNSEGIYENGGKAGKWTYWHPNGRIENEGLYQNGLREGKTEYFFESGKRRSEGNFTKGKKQGLWSFWYENGQFKSKGKFKEGEKTGPWEFYHDNGKLKSKGSFVVIDYMQFKMGWWEFYHYNGNKKSEGEFSNGWKDGPWTYWHENGKMKSQGSYKMGKKDGRWIHYYGSGSKEKEVMWDNGFEIKDKK